MKQTTNKVATTAKVAKDVKANVSDSTQSDLVVASTLKALRNTAPIVKLKESINKSSVDVFTKSLKLGTLLSARLDAFNAPEFKAFLKAEGCTLKVERERLWDAVGMSGSYFHRHVTAGSFLIGDADSGEQFIVYREAMLALDERCALDVDTFNSWMKGGKAEASITIKAEAVEGDGEGDEEFSDEEMAGVAAQFVVSTDAVSGSIHFNDDSTKKAVNGNEQLLKAMLAKCATSLGLVCMTVDEFDAVMTSGVEA
tara:strand:+ start:202 stop:966 length:765 start_codon:yes stop_codon:yes gene_type:complete